MAAKTDKQYTDYGYLLVQWFSCCSFDCQLIVQYNNKSWYEKLTEWREIFIFLKSPNSMNNCCNLLISQGSFVSDLFLFMYVFVVYSYVYFNIAFVISSWYIELLS